MSWILVLVAVVLFAVDVALRAFAETAIDWLVPLGLAFFAASFLPIDRVRVS